MFAQSCARASAHEGIALLFLVLSCFEVGFLIGDSLLLSMRFAWGLIFTPCFSLLLAAAHQNRRELHDENTRLRNERDTLKVEKVTDSAEVKYEPPAPIVDEANIANFFADKRRMRLRTGGKRGKKRRYCEPLIAFPFFCN